MKKEVKVVGGQTLGITFSTEERRVHNIEQGDVLNLSDMVVEKQQQTDENISNIMAKQKQKKVKKEINKIMGKEMKE